MLHFQDKSDVFQIYSMISAVILLVPRINVDVAKCNQLSLSMTRFCAAWPTCRIYDDRSSHVLV